MHSRPKSHPTFPDPLSDLEPCNCVADDPAAAAKIHHQSTSHVPPLMHGGITRAQESQGDESPRKAASPTPSRFRRGRRAMTLALSSPRRSFTCSHTQALALALALVHMLPLTLTLTTPILIPDPTPTPEPDPGQPGLSYAHGEGLGGDLPCAGAFVSSE